MEVENKFHIPFR